MKFLGCTTFQALSSRVWLVVSVLESAAVEHFHHRRKFHGTELLRQPQTVSLITRKLSLNREPSPPNQTISIKLAKMKQRDPKEAYVSFSEMFKGMKGKRVWLSLTSDKRPPRNGRRAEVLRAVSVLMWWGDRWQGPAARGPPLRGYMSSLGEGPPYGAFALVGPSPLWGWGSCQ